MHLQRAVDISGLFVPHAPRVCAGIPRSSSCSKFLVASTPGGAILAFVLSTRILFVRHAHTSGNGAGLRVRMSGVTDLPLSDHGQQQVAALPHRFQGQRFAAIYSSPLRRARETAHAISSAGAGVVLVHRQLIEIDAGQADGLPIETVQKSFPEHWEANLRQDDDQFRWPGGESYAEFRQRALSTTAELASKHVGERIAIVTHAGFISQVLGAIHGARAANWERFRLSNTGTAEIEWTDRPRLIAISEAA